MSFGTAQAQHSDLNRLFEEHYDEFSSIDAAVREELSDLVDEKQLDNDTLAWALQSLDITTIFRFYKKHKWNRIAAQSALTSNALWRAKTFTSLRDPKPSSLLRFLESRDRFGRPILVIQARNISTLSLDELKHEILCAYEIGRLHIADLYKQSSDHIGPSSQVERVLQFTLVADLKGLGVRGLPFDLIPWLGQTISPNYPGIIGPSYIVNHSWLYNGIWEMAKRMLPQRAIDRIFFPALSELHEHIPPKHLPENFGGSLPSPSPTHDPFLHRYYTCFALSGSRTSSMTSMPESSVLLTPQSSSPTVSTTTPILTEKYEPQPTPPQVTRRPRPPVPPRSNINPYYGYPVVYDDAHGPNHVPHLAAGRRRKRDLAKTLLMLLVQRLALAIPNIFLQPMSHRVGTGLEIGRRKWRSWIWWALGLWLAATARRVLRLRSGAMVNGLVSVDGRIKHLGLGVIVGGEFLRRLWLALNAARATALVAVLA